MSQAVLPSKTASPMPWRALRFASPFLLAALFSGPAAVRYWAREIPHLHLHAPRWALLTQAKPLIQVHVVAASTALLIGTVLLVGVKGTGRHRVLGWVWVAAMAAVALSSIFIRETNHGGWSFLHLFTGWVLLALPVAVAAVRRRKLALHRRMMTGLFTGGLALNSLIALLPGRLLWRVIAG